MSNLTWAANHWVRMLAVRPVEAVVAPNSADACLIDSHLHQQHRISSWPLSFPNSLYHGPLATFVLVFLVQYFLRLEACFPDLLSTISHVPAMIPR
jgi:hypothetical protein